MTGAVDRTWAGSMAATYDRCLGSAVFGPHAADLSARAAADRPSTVLELAAGSGILTRELARRLPGARIAATDLNWAMADYGARQVPQAAWQQADALTLPFSSSSFDVVICQFGVMFFAPRPAAFAEVARVLRAGGRFWFSTWDVIERNDFAAALAEGLELEFPDDPPTFMARIPHGYADLTVVAADLRAADLTPDQQATVVLTGHAGSAAQLATGFCQGTPLRMAIESRGDLRTATNAIAARMTARLGAGPATGRLTAHLVAARRAD